MERSHFTPVIPPVTVRFYPAGQTCTDPLDCDILLVDHGTISADIIEGLEKVATVREPELRGYTWCDHAGTIRTTLGPAPMVSEMGFRGRERNPLDSYHHRDYAVVSFRSATSAQRAASAAFDDAMSHVDYGWFEYLPIVTDDATGLQFAGSYADHVICSARAALVAAPLGFMGDRPAERIEPMRLAMYFGARH